MIPSFVECLARDGYERVQTTKIGSVIKQNGADLRAVHSKKGSAELCVNARTLTVSINVTTVRLGRLLFPPRPTCLLTPCQHLRTMAPSSAASGRFPSRTWPRSRLTPLSQDQVRIQAAPLPSETVRHRSLPISALIVIAWIGHLPVTLVFQTRPTFENQPLPLSQPHGSRNATEVTFTFLYEEAVDDLKETLRRRFLVSFGSQD